MRVKIHSHQTLPLLLILLFPLPALQKTQLVIQQWIIQQIADKTGNTNPSEPFVLDVEIKKILRHQQSRSTIVGLLDISHFLLFFHKKVGLKNRKSITDHAPESYTQCSLESAWMAIVPTVAIASSRAGGHCGDGFQLSQDFCAGNYRNAPGWRQGDAKAKKKSRIFRSGIRKSVHASNVQGAGMKAGMDWQFLVVTLFLKESMRIKKKKDFRTLLYRLLKKSH